MIIEQGGNDRDNLVGWKLLLYKRLEKWTELNYQDGQMVYLVFYSIMVKSGKLKNKTMVEFC